MAAAFFVGIKLHLEAKNFLTETGIKKLHTSDSILQTSWVVAVVEHHDPSKQDIMFVSTSHNSERVGKHAEERILEHFEKKLSAIKSINLTHSPCSSCTAQLISAFLKIKKETKRPAINFLCIHITRSKYSYYQSFKNLQLLQTNGFELGVWCDFRDKMEHRLLRLGFREDYEKVRNMLERHRSELKYRELKLKMVLMFNVTINQFY